MIRENIKNIIISLVVLVLCLCIFNNNTRKEIVREREVVEERVQMNANTQASIINQDINEAIDVTDIVSLSIDANHGKITDFPHLGMHLYERNKNIIAIKLAPNGIVSETYPEKEKRGNINLNKKGETAKVLNYAREHRGVIVQGPITYNKKNSLAIISPIFYPYKNHRTFYGYVICMVRCPSIFNTAIRNLKELDYNYQLSVKNPINNKYRRITGSGSTHHAYTATFKAGSCSWRLSVTRKQAPVSLSTIIRMYLGTISLSFFIALLVYFVLYQRRQHKKLQRMMATDYLTQIYNRAGFDEESKRYMKKHPGEHCVGVLMDIDDFKYINDLYGHSVGDKVLKHLSQILKEELPKDSIIGRNGGDEFSAVIKHATSEEVAPILKRLGENPIKLDIDGKPYHYSLSIGYAEYPTQTPDISTLMREADAALYVVKVKGKHGAQPYDADMHNQGRVKLGFKLQDVANYLPGAFFIYREEDGELLYINLEVIKLFGCTDYDDFMRYTHHNFKGIVHPDDYDSALASIKEQSDKHDVRVDYRVITKNRGEVLMHEVGRLVQSEYFGRIWYVIMGPRPVKKKPQ